MQEVGAGFRGHAGPVSWASRLLADLGRVLDAGGASRLAVTGADPVLPTRFRVGEAAAAALLAVGVASDDLHVLRGGRPQTISIDVGAAAASLLSFAFQRAPDLARERPPVPTIALFRTRDGGWVHLHGGFPHLHHGVLTLLGCGDGADAIARAVLRWDAASLEDALADRGLCGVQLRSADAWRAHPQGIALAGTPTVELLRIGSAEPKPLPGARIDRATVRPLSGIRVLDLTRVLAGPTCARTLAEHGADVLHVRSPALPFLEPFVVDTNPGKRSCHLDLTRREDAARLASLVGEADVFSQSYRPGSLGRRGFDAEALAALRPGIVVVSTDAYGHTGPWRDRAGWEQLAQTATGMAHEHGSASAPAIVPAAVTDYTTGYLAALGVMRALARRAEEGGSWHVRVSLARTAQWIQSLPRTPQDAEPVGIDAKGLRGYEILMDTAWGRLVRLGPVLRMSETSPMWTHPPVPLGSHPPTFV